MEKVLHRADERGKGEHGWLSTRYSFSFADWYDPSRMGFGALRVINDDRIAAANGFGAHRHQDMEIITIVTKGAVTHEDSMGNKGEVPAGDVQAMSAGLGVTHAERNDSPDEELTLFQIWISSDRKGAAPRYAQKPFGLDSKTPGETLLVAPDGVAGALPIYQDAYISHGIFDKEHPLTHALKDPMHGLYVFVIEGLVEVAGETLKERDAVGIADVTDVTLASEGFARVLLIEVPLV
jgi:redox-sensitive bicupin YhaK (pirin superfamily)